MKNRPVRAGNVMLAVLIFIGIFTTIGTALLSYTTEFARSTRVTVAATQALALAEAAVDKAAYELNQNGSYAGETDTALGPGTFSVTVSAVDSTHKQITATAYVPNRSNPVASKAVRVMIGIDTSTISFRYGIQSGDGGLALQNSAQVEGNIYSTGPITLANSSTINGDAISAGAGGTVSGAGNTITGSVYGHTLSNVKAGGDAYYVSQSDIYAGGSRCPNARCHPGSPDQGTVPLPISDAQIAAWETDAAAGGTISSCDRYGNYTLSSNASLGPVKILCNLVLSGSATITITGPLWVVGNITTNNSVTVKISPALGSENVAIIADNPANPTTSGIVNINSSGQFQGSGAPGSYVFIISMNKSAEMGGTTAAISMSQSSNALVIYASHGKIALTNSVSLKEVTGYLTTLSQSATVDYDSGLPSTVFKAGPGASWAFVPGTYAAK